MGYDIFQFGALNLDGKIQPVPQYPKDGGDIPQYDGKATISLGTSVPGKSITWIKPNGSNLLVADRALLSNVSWNDLNSYGFVAGRRVKINNQFFRCRLLLVGEELDDPNEWDEILNKTGEQNFLWNWREMFFWGVDGYGDTSLRSVRGYDSARYHSVLNFWLRDSVIGFRPVLEPICPDTVSPNCKLDGADFQLSNIPGGIPGEKGFCPILQPAQIDVFSGIPSGERIRMYTFITNGHPVHMDEQIKNHTKLTLTDRYFGDEYLISWVVSNGIAVASHSL